MTYLELRDDLVATAVYQPEPAAAAAARRFVRDTLRSWDLAGWSASLGTPTMWEAEDRPGALDALAALVDDAVLLTSELVTNAVLHAGTPVQVTCRLLADAGTGGAPDSHHGWAVEIAVLDRRPALLRTDLPRTAAEAAERVSGRGLLLPSELASAWGVTYARAAKAVWFRMALPAPQAVPAAGSCLGPG
jgi:anti-sigma regulatory factor (Ser/Thr protein kinase)